MSIRKPYFRSKLAAMKKSKILLISVILVITAIVGTTTAILVSNSSVYKNIFKNNDISTEIEEVLNGDTKSNVTVKNTGTADAYIRAFVSVTWQDADGNVYGTMPVAGTDYTITYDVANGWTRGADGFYYWNEAVAAKASTGVLISSCTPVDDKAPDGYELTVEVLASGIQTVPTHVVTTEWSSGVSAADGKTLTVK